jgi:hypothetical protein
MIVAEIILWAAGAYLVIGLMAGVPFAMSGVNRIDPAARGASLAFRLLILPGSVALWPWIVGRWLHPTKEVGHP